MRRLVHIPIIHTAADLGSLSELVQAHYAKLCGKAGWSRREHVVKALWSDIQANLDALRLDGPRTRIYQDGLPICGFEDRIVCELADAGSSNHQLILRLVDRGAVVMGTEDPRLLMEEYELQKKMLQQGNSGQSASEQTLEHSQRVLAARDRFIADRIGATLAEGEVGLLFLGAMHRLDALRSIGIQLETLGAGSHKAVGRPRT